MVVLAAGPANEPLASELAEIVDPGSTGRHRSSLTWSASAAIRPLPVIPAGRPDTVELTVPIEFDLR